MWHLDDDEILEWLSLFGKVESQIEYRDRDDAPLKTDSLTVSMKLRKHIPGILPAFGRRLFVSYRGQPIQCGKCMDLGHIRSECKQDRTEWKEYVRTQFLTGYIPKNMLGDWANLLSD